MTTADVARLLGLTLQQVMYRMGRDAIQVPKDGGRYAWTLEAVEELRSAQRRREALQSEAPAQGLTSHEAARELGVPYGELMQIVRRQRIPVPRIGPHRHLVFDATALALVRAALQPSVEPPPAGFSTRQVAVVLGLSYQTLCSVMHSLRKTLPLQKAGSRLLWPPEAVAIVREVVERRHVRSWLGEAEDYERALAGIATLEVTLRRLADETAKLKGSLSRRPAETFFIHTLPARTHVVRAPIGVPVMQVAKTGFQASLAELSLVTEGRTRQEAARLMRQMLWMRYREVAAAPGSAPEEWTILEQLIVPRPEDEPDSP